MPKLYRKGRIIGNPPGTLMGSVEKGHTRIHVMEYDTNSCEEVDLTTVEDILAIDNPSKVRWINIDAPDETILRNLGSGFDIHPLVLEDIMNKGQRPKIEDYDAYLFFVIKMVYQDKAVEDIYAEQVGMILKNNTVITFQEKTGDVFDVVRKRLRQGGGRICQMGADYLSYALLDAIVDHYFIILENLGERIDILENNLWKEVNNRMPMEIHRLKTEVIFLKKQIWPLREILGGFQRMDSSLIQSSTALYLRDTYDHMIQINETIEAFREVISGLHDIYLSNVNNRMNEIMKVLTIFAAIFIPLTFIAGIYGMNFEHMPELKWPYGYFMIVGLMASIGIGMLLYFKKQKWF